MSNRKRFMMPQKPKITAQNDSNSEEQARASRADADEQAKDTREDSESNKDNGTRTSQTRSTGEANQASKEDESSDSISSHSTLSIDKPLNLSRLTRSKAPNNGENRFLSRSAHAQSGLERLKHDTVASSRLHSPRPQHSSSYQLTSQALVSPAIHATHSSVLVSSEANQFVSAEDGVNVSPSRLSRTKSPVPAFTAWSRTNLLSEPTHADSHLSSEHSTDDYSLDGNATLVAEEINFNERRNEYDVPINEDGVNKPMTIPHFHKRSLNERQKSIEELYPGYNSSLTTSIRKEDDTDTLQDIHSVHARGSKRFKADRLGNIDDSTDLPNPRVRGAVSLDPALGPPLPRAAQQHMQVPYQYSPRSQHVPSRPPSVVPTHDQQQHRSHAQPYPNTRHAYMQDSALFQFLGVDLETYLSSHISEYEDAKKKWVSCSQKEWEDEGSKEMKDLFQDALQFATNYMIEKAKRLNNLHDALSVQKSTMTDRDQRLKEMKDGLVMRFGGVDMTNSTNKTA